MGMLSLTSIGNSMMTAFFIIGLMIATGVLATYSGITYNSHKEDLYIIEV